MRSLRRLGGSTEKHLKILAGVVARPRAQALEYASVGRDHQDVLEACDLAGELERVGISGHFETDLLVMKRLGHLRCWSLNFLTDLSTLLTGPEASK